MYGSDDNDDDDYYYDYGDEVLRLGRLGISINGNDDDDNDWIDAECVVTIVKE